MNKIPLTPNLLDGKKGREGFYIKEEHDIYWICYLNGKDGCSHCVPISEGSFNYLLDENLGIISTPVVKEPEKDNDSAFKIMGTITFLIIMAGIFIGLNIKSC